MNEPIMILQKNAEATTNKIRLPKAIIEQWGKEFYLEVYQDKIILKPVKKGK
jgi:hypothetical protein